MGYTDFINTESKQRILEGANVKLILKYPFPHF